MFSPGVPEFGADEQRSGAIAGEAGSEADHGLSGPWLRLLFWLGQPSTIEWF
jgi:hypothetical protein